MGNPAAISVANWRVIKARSLTVRVGWKNPEKNLLLRALLRRLGWSTSPESAPVPDPLEIVVPASPSRLPACRS